MHLARLRAVGGSVMFAIPRPIRESLGLTANGTVGLSVSDGRLVIDPHPTGNAPLYTLAELLAQCDPTAEPTEEARAWLEAEPAGREAM